jgi:hypothetical protein
MLTTMLASAGRRAPIRPAAPARAPDPARAQAPPVDALRWESKGLAGLRVSVPARAVEYRPGPAGPRAAPALLLAGARRVALRRGGEGGRARRLQRSDINRLHAMEMAAATAAAATGPSIGRRRATETAAKAATATVAAATAAGAAAGA